MAQQEFSPLSVQSLFLLGSILFLIGSLLSFKNELNNHRNGV
ncbi:hypothetical protein [Anaerobacillus alkaliphilus]|nr:hypothetical protein [Anaerobacillus alkaliphilus]